MTKITLPAEWHPQDAILITWPHRQSPWRPMLSDVLETYFDLVTTLSHYQALIIQTHPSIDLDTLALHLHKRNANVSNCHFVASITNDTWTRDYGPITVLEKDKLKLLDFQFNGWGNKFESQADNMSNQALHSLSLFKNLTQINWVLEGGSIESDGQGSLLTTSQCNLNINRNGLQNKALVETKFKEWFGVEQILWLHHGNIIGDDTDSHIDTLARFAPNNTLIFQGCQSPEDEHFDTLLTMKQELQQFRNLQGEPYRCIELPLPPALYSDANQRLPATYANFLITNELVLVPTYQVNTDKQAIEVIKGAFPNHITLGVDARALIQEGGSLHCITMQMPKDSVNFDMKFLSI